MDECQAFEISFTRRLNSVCALQISSPTHPIHFDPASKPETNFHTTTMPPLTETKLTPALYEVFRSYKKATTVVERWLAVTSDKKDTKVRLSISEMRQAADYIKNKRLKVPELIYYAFDKAIRARSEVTNHFKGLFATKTAEANNSSHEHFTKM